jgi:DNA-binding GntR family transcriptional regulator
MLAKALQSFQLDRHASYTAQVENVLREAIVRGHLPPGTSLSEAAISATLGISRTPAREALALLADEQLVLIYPQVKTVVAPVRRSLIDEGRFVRSTLESANHAELVRTITQRQLDSLAALVAAQRKAASAGDVEAFFKLDEAMHRSMFEFAGRAHVWTMLQGVKRHFDRVRFLLLERVAYHARRAQEEHESIMDRLRARDAAGLTEAVSHHINAIKDHLQELHDRAPESYFVD